MNILMDLRLMAVVAGMIAAFQLPSLAYALATDEPATPFLFSFIGGGLLTAFTFWYTRNASTLLRARDGYLVASFGWFLATLVGATPYVMAGLLEWPGAIFETASGFTTTGSSVLTDIESWPKSMLLWRSTTHWLGGMGMLLLTIAILPFLGIGGMQLIKAEVPGPSADKLAPRLATTAQLLWTVYLGISLLNILLYYWAGMNLFDAITHTFATLATGGFSTKNLSLAAFSPAAQWIATVFMFISGANFVLHFRLIASRGRDVSVFKDPELRLYAAIVAGAGLFTAVMIFFQQGYDVEESFRHAYFQVVSIMTTTGFASADWEKWSPVLHLVFIALMVVGGMSGSTGGGVKVIRVLLLMKLVSSITKKLLQPGRVTVVTLGGKEVSDDVLEGSIAMVAIFMVMVFVTGVILTAMGMDMISAMTAALTAAANVGPGLGSIGPMDNFSGIPDAGKLLLALVMIAGRLEVFTVYVLFTIRFWRD